MRSRLLTQYKMHRSGVTVRNQGVLIAGMWKNEMVGPSDILERSGKRKVRRTFNTLTLNC